MIIVFMRKNQIIYNFKDRERETKETMNADKFLMQYCVEFGTVVYGANRVGDSK